MFVQALRKQGMTPAFIARYPKDRTTIGALSAGESVQVRARITSDAEDFPDWQASDWRDAKASDDAMTYLSSAASELLDRSQLSDLVSGGIHVAGVASQTIGDDIEQQTLRDVLVEILPRTTTGLLCEVSTIAAKAIRAAFDELRDTDAGKS